MISLPVGGLKMSAGVGAAGLQALSTSLVKLAAFSANSASGAVSAYSAGVADGDPSVNGDPVNNWLKLNTPGAYLIGLSISALVSAANDVVIQLRKNGATIVPELSAESNGVAGGRFNFNILGILNLLRTDLPATGGLVAFAEPSDPVPTFVGGGGAPKSITTLEIMVGVVSGTPNFTAEYINFWAARVA